MAEEKAPEPTMTPADLQKMAHDYQVPVSEATIKQIAGEGAVAPEKAKAFEEYLKTSAQGLYPTLAPQIKAGIPTAYLLDPYRQVGKQVLGEQFEPDFVGDARHARALSGSADPTTGRPVPMALDDWAKYLRQEPTLGWSKTPEGQRAYQEVLGNLHKALTEAH